MDCSATVFVDEFSNFSFSVVLLVFGRPERSSSTDTRQALKRECHSETVSSLKKFSETDTKHFRGSDSGFAELHAKLEGTLLDFAIHHRQNETRSYKKYVSTVRCPVAD
jgi:hypothetical protein